MPGIKITSVESNSVYEEERFELVRGAWREKENKICHGANVFRNFKGIQRRRLKFTSPATPRKFLALISGGTGNIQTTAQNLDSLGIQIPEGNVTGAVRRAALFAFRPLLPLSSLPPRSHFARGLIDNCSPLNKALRARSRASESGERNSEKGWHNALVRLPVSLESRSTFRERRMYPATLNDS